MSEIFNSKMSDIRTTSDIIKRFYNNYQKMSYTPSSLCLQCAPSTQYTPFVRTPFFRSINEISPFGYTQEPDLNYTPYDLFCLTTKLLFRLNRVGITDYPKLVSQELDGRMVVTVKLLRGDKFLELSQSEVTQLQQFVDWALATSPHHCVVFSLGINHITATINPTLRPSSETPSFYPRGWLTSIIPYLQIPVEYNPFIDNSAIFVELQPDNLFNSTYDQLLQSIYSQFESLYNIGSVVCNKYLAARWNLILLPTGSPSYPSTKASVNNTDLINYAIVTGKRASQAQSELENAIQEDEFVNDTDLNETLDTGLYIATWKDRRFAPDISVFLQSRVAGDGYIRMSISYNLQIRHRVIELLNTYDPLKEPIFVGSDVLITADSLDEAYRLAAIVESAKTTATGKVLIIPTTTTSSLESYQRNAQQLWGDTTQCVIYPSSDHVRPYWISCSVPLTADLIEDPEHLRARVNPILMKKESLQ